MYLITAIIYITVSVFVGYYIRGCLCDIGLANTCGMYERYTLRIIDYIKDYVSEFDIDEYYI